ncbi:baseplate assembly protein [Pseudoalteromonas denitrificans]|uniref:Phage-related baseplate assembly protein n=1 Tax=Pseudoalteromonas denitrificans DSM 6059 TaxID=1123010 RepID=A0A1I1Q3L5_9GAMM|nr:baseplate J/gp47 family protein [Pseudoalteromonas denitrificans]SFD16746.1 Phage-related baseplate assembly protein [Pseudoalteromonas denitrificans DSM 6059]
MSQINFSPVDISKLPIPNVIESLDFESIKAEILADYTSRYPNAQIELASEPVVKLIETFAYRELLVRQRVNDGANSVLLAKATGAQLDYLGNRFNVKRQLVIKGNTSVTPVIADVYETDERFRKRIQLSLEGFSTAGPIGAYVYHALAASAFVKDVTIDAPEFSYAEIEPALLAQLPENVAVLQCTYDAGLTNPMPGDVAITTLSTLGNGKDEVLASLVVESLSDDEIRPLTDHVCNREVEIIEYELNATLFCFKGTDSKTIQAASLKAVKEYMRQHHKLGLAVTQSALYSALHQPGVERVVLTSPSADIMVENHQAAYCIGEQVHIKEA